MPEKDKSRYLDYLPAIYGDPDHAYVGEFLLPFEQVLTDVEDLLAIMDRYFAPALTAEGFLPWLAQWVALVLDENWDVTKQRRFIAAALELYRLRGTAAGIRRYLQVYDEQYTVQFRESRIPCGMQIGVSSRIGGIAPGNPPLSADQAHGASDAPHLPRLLCSGHGSQPRAPRASCRSRGGATLATVLPCG